jgi:hypothetical protein
MYEGQLVRATDGRWMTKPPSRCPNGHSLGPNQVLVGHVACLGHGGGHTPGIAEAATPWRMDHRQVRTAQH